MSTLVRGRVKHEVETPSAIRNQGAAVAGWLRTQMSLPIESRHRAAAESLGIRLEQGSQCVITLRPPELRYQVKVTDTAGGHIVPTTFSTEYEHALDSSSSFFRFGRVISLDGGQTLRWPMINDTTVEGEVVRETAPTSTAADFAVGQLVFFGTRFSSKPIIISRSLWEDAGPQLETELARVCAARIGRAFNRSMTLSVNGFGGVLTSGTLGVTTAVAGVISGDDIIDLIYSVDAAFRDAPGAAFMMHSDIMKYVAKLKDGDGLPIFNRDLKLLAGFPVIYNRHMPSSIATTNKTIAFGDFGKVYIRQEPSLTLKVFSEESGVAELDQLAVVGLQTMHGNVMNTSGTENSPIRYLQQAA